MARPTIPIPSVFAADANYSTGEPLLIGTPTKIARSAAEIAEGWRANETPPAQEYNDLWYSYSTWAKWVAEGLTTAALNDHIVETSSAGVARIACLFVGGTAYAGVALNVNSNASGAALQATDSIGNFAIAASGTGAVATIRATSSGINPAIEGLALANGPGIVGTGDAAGSGVEGYGDTTGIGVYGEGGSTGGSGVNGLSKSASPGVTGTAGSVAASPGVFGEASHVDGHGVKGQTFGAGATASSHAIFGDASGDANGVYGEGVDGYGVVAAATGVERAAFRKVPQTTRGGAYIQNGDEYYDSTTDQHKSVIKGQDQALWATTKGYTQGFASADALDSQTGTTFKTVLTCNLSLPYEPRQTGKVRIHVAFECSVPITANKFIWRIRDTTAGANVLADTTEEHANASALGDTRYVCRNVEYTVPAVGARTFTIDIRNSNAGGASYIRRMSAEVTGVFP